MAASVAVLLLQIITMQSLLGDGRARGVRWEQVAEIDICRWLHSRSSCET
jgi:hypothetical protein